jgi:hypothetical protein
VIRQALVGEFSHVAGYVELDEVVVVHGKQGYRRKNKCYGGDLICHQEAIALGFTPEPHPADWKRHGRAAGPIRNAEMVALGADVCLALPIGLSPGTRGCIDLAEAAGIPVRCYEPAVTS